MHIHSDQFGCEMFSKVLFQAGGVACRLDVVVMSLHSVSCSELGVTCCRLRRGSQSLPKTRSSSLKSFNMEDSAELADSEDDLEDT